MRILFSITLLCFGWMSSLAQYAPRDNWAGSTAIPSDSAIFVSWANNATVTRGNLDIRTPSMGMVNAGEDAFCLSYADRETVSLGDGGSVVLEFDVPIVNGTGFDFAVFENGFHIRNNSDSDFLELAFVEVSNDGIRWVRFPAYSDNDTNLQLNTYDGMKASRVHNLAGKYTAGYGTPFDLEDLKDSADIDLMNIRYIRIIDVVGTLEEAYCSRDSRGYKISEPFPTAFMQGGFDLDAIGVIYNQHSPNGLKETNQFLPFPNPSTPGQGIQLSRDEAVDYRIFSLNGQLVEQGNAQIAGNNLNRGMYIIHYQSAGKTNQLKWVVE